MPGAKKRGKWRAVGKGIQSLGYNRLVSSGDLLCSKVRRVNNPLYLKLARG